MTILESAEWLLQEFGNNENHVICEKNIKTEFAPDNEMILQNTKLRKLGWEPRVTLKEGYKRLIDYVRLEKR